MCEGLPHDGTGRSWRFGARWVHTPPTSAQEADQRVQKGGRAALEAPRRTDARQLPHEQPQIEAADVYEQPFQDVGMPAQMHAAHAAGLIEMSVGPFQQFAPLPHPPWCCVIGVIVKSRCFATTILSNDE